MFKKGTLVFTDGLKLHEGAGLSAPYFTARAIVVAQSGDQYHGSIEELQISDLILKQSSFLYDGVNTREAHKLYTWPRNLGDHKAWAESKKAFLEQHVMHFPLQIRAVEQEHHLTWEFITPEQFKKMPAGITYDEAFRDFYEHPGNYFFLRKERNDPV